MNRYVKIMTLLLTIITIPVSCSTVPKFSDVQDRDWKLVEIRINPESIIINESDDFFTLRFDMERVNGIGAPNRYFAPYLLADKQGIAIKAIAQTQMAALFEPEELKEHEFFIYLQNTRRWNLVRGNLELYTRGTDGTEAVLVFVP
jgi:heat shock protein HslJ